MASARDIALYGPRIVGRTQKKNGYAAACMPLRFFLAENA